MSTNSNKRIELENNLHALCWFIFIIEKRNREIDAKYREHGYYEGLKREDIETLGSAGLPYEITKDWSLTIYEAARWWDKAETKLEGLEVSTCNIRVKSEDVKCFNFKNVEDILDCRLQVLPESDSERVIRNIYDMISSPDERCQKFMDSLGFKLPG